VTVGRRIDVRNVGREIMEGLFELRSFEERATYFDGVTHRRIGTIGRDLFRGRILAAVDDRFANHPNYECLLNIN
jgi:hypothetical protein